MRPKSFMLIAGEASGDMLAAELVRALRQEMADTEVIPTTDYQPLQTSLEPRFFGAGGPRMAAEGVELAFDMTVHSVIGLFEVVRNYRKFRRLFHQLFQLALQRQPDVIICVDFSGFNRRFGHAIKQYIRAHADWFHDWNPKLIQYVSPQVWASREGRAYQMARDYDLVLSIFPFEKEWYAKRVPQLAVEFVGHPIVDRYGEGREKKGDGKPMVLLLPGSRPDELRRHLPVIIGAMDLIRAKVPDLRARMVLPNEGLIKQARALGVPAGLDGRAGGLAESLAEASIALASSGTVTTECAYFGVPTVALYKTSWGTYQIARRIMKVKYLAMPNVLAGEEVFPEFIQAAATPDNIARAAVELLRDAPRRARLKAKLAEIVASLGGPGAPRRAAKAIVETLADKAN
ncbi:MAG: lipid-A-disaccharide synthase [Limisphaerales bacterium]